MSDEVLLEAEGVKVYFPLFRGILRKQYAEVKAVDGVDLQIKQGETLGLVGESGCGKTTLGRGLLQLVRPTSGSVLFKGIDLCQIGGKRLRGLRRHFQIIYQDPFESMDPLMSVGAVISEPLKIHRMMSDAGGYKDRVGELLEQVRLPEDTMYKYPHELSGGQRQRICVARALALNPDLIVCDEAVSALDVSVQAQIIELLMETQRKLNLAYLFISHDIAAVRQISNWINVMYLGVIVEYGNTSEVIDHPLHPYTQGLLSAIPIPDPYVEKKRERIMLMGEPPSPLDISPGCRFNPRCHACIPGKCDVDMPELKQVSGDHWVACHET